MKITALAVRKKIFTIYTIYYIIIILMKIIKKSHQQIDKIRTSGQYLTELLHLCYQHCAPDIMLKDIEQIVIDYVNKHNLIAAFK
jgi:methionine aminopeptidase